LARPTVHPRPEQGRVFGARRTVRLGDTTPDGRLRLDALARYLQDVAEDDVADAGWEEPVGWLVRRTTLVVERFAAKGEDVLLETFCTGLAARWAERTTTVTGSAGARLQAQALWVAVDPASGRPARLSEAFGALYGPSAGERSVSARLDKRPPPEGARRRPWPLRATDLDVVGHVNNAVHWAAVEEALTSVPWLPAWAELAYHEELRGSAAPDLVTAEGEGELSAWLFDQARLVASAQLVAGT